MTAHVWIVTPTRVDADGVLWADTPIPANTRAHAERVAADLAQGDPDPTLNVSIDGPAEFERVPVDQDGRRRLASLWRDALAASREGHDHRHGPENCHICVDYL